MSRNELYARACLTLLCLIVEWLLLGVYLSPVLDFAFSNWYGLPAIFAGLLFLPIVIIAPIVRVVLNARRG